MKQPMSISAPLQKPDGSRITAVRFETSTTLIYEHVDEDTPIEITEVIDGTLASSEVVDFRDIVDRSAPAHPGAVLELDRRARHGALLEPPPTKTGANSVKIEIKAPPGMTIAIGISVAAATGVA